MGSRGNSPCDRRRGRRARRSARTSRRARTRRAGAGRAPQALHPRGAPGGRQPRATGECARVGRKASGAGSQEPAGATTSPRFQPSLLQRPLALHHARQALLRRESGVERASWRVPGGAEAFRVCSTRRRQARRLRCRPGWRWGAADRGTCAVTSPGPWTAARWPTALPGCAARAASTAMSQAWSSRTAPIPWGSGGTPGCRFGAAGPVRPGGVCGPHTSAASREVSPPPCAAPGRPGTAGPRRRR
jgi:hypothetical protein